MLELQFDWAFLRLRPRPAGAAALVLSAAILACGGAARENEADEKRPERRTGDLDTVSGSGSRSAPSPQTEIIGGARFLSIQSESFDEADIEKKNLVVQLCRAAAVLDDWSYAVQGEDVVLLRGMLAGIQKAGKHIPVQLREKLDPYTAAFWVSHGPVDAWTKQQIRASFIPGELAAAAQIAMEKGYPLGVGHNDMGDLASNRLEQLEAMLEEVRPLIFGDRSRDSDTSQEPGDSDAVGSKVESAEPGRDLWRKEYSAQMVGRIAPARALSDAVGRNVLEHAARAVTAASSRALKAYQEAAAEASAEVMFWSDCLDSRGEKPEDCRRNLGAWVCIRDKKAEAVFERVVDAAPSIEAVLPFEKKWKNDVFAPLDVRAPVYEVVCGAGSLGAALPIGSRGSGALLSLGDGDLHVSNLGEAVVRTGGGLEVRRALLGQASADRWTKCSAVNAAMRLAVERTHAPRSGAMDLRKKGAPEHYLKEHAAVWEELRARLIGAVVAAGPLAGRLAGGGDPICAREVYEDLLMRPVMDALSRTNAEDDVASRADRIIVNWLLAQSLVEPAQDTWKLSASESLEKGLADLLSDVQKVRSLGIYQEAQSFLHKYDTPIGAGLMARARRVQGLLEERLVVIYPLLERSAQNDITQRVMGDFFSRRRQDEIARAAH